MSTTDTPAFGMPFTQHRTLDAEPLDALVNRATEIDLLVNNGSSQDVVGSKLYDFLAAAHYNILGVALAQTDTWHRGRKQPSDASIPANLSSFIYPRDPGPTYGRLNQPHQPVFYASWNRSTVLTELAPARGDKVWFIEARPMDNKSVKATVVGAYEYFYRSGRLIYPSAGIEEHLTEFFRRALPDDILRTVFIDAFLARILRNPDSRSYPATSAFAQQVYRIKEPTGILYPSAKTFGSINLALPASVFDAHFEVMAASIATVEHSPGYDVYNAPLDHLPCTTFSESGNILWASEARTFPSFSFRGGLSYPSEARGWSSLAKN